MKLNRGNLSCDTTPEVNQNGTKWDLGANPKHAKPVMNSFAYQLMPHLNDHPSSLKPAFLLNGTRENCDVVIGIPTVHRDKGSYIISTVSNVIHGMTDEEKDKNLIVVLVAETQMDYVRPLVEKLATLFSEYIYTGLVELVVPSPFYYPDFDNLPLNFGDSNKRVMWRTKHNLNVLYVMAYARSRGTYYLMLEDDVTVKERFIEHMLDFAKAKTKSNPDWYVLEFCNIGGIGKLFKTSDLIYFMTYIQLFYKQMPIDWLLESYIADSSCSLDRATPGYNEARSLFFPHDNPAVQRVFTDIKIFKNHTPMKAYDGKTFFWGINPVKGNVVEFWFREPTNIVRYTFRSGNFDRYGDIFDNAVVEALPIRKRKFVMVKRFDELGFASGDLNLGALVAIRIRVTKNSTHWVILSEPLAYIFYGYNALDCSLESLESTQTYLQDVKRLSPKKYLPPDTTA
ncbi:hypothetical protein KGM_203381 [Danaus plexippus plexippus]|uniref:Alpha-1,3-mannosyl-glycoprotein 4-beta-N-acetylglucosaminyltransferase A-like n=1 Tax=Danaus plexippus plexippus TaxID=278856 RepID=A0A212EQP6_DANPL|nr:hypothetical protein KGM_203381 [Danaus plexippus plexippus]